MDRIMYRIPSGQKFILTENEHLYVDCRGEGQVHLGQIIQLEPHREKGFMQPGGFDTERIDTITNLSTFVAAPVHTHLQLHTEGVAMAFCVQFSGENQSLQMPHPRYTVLGSQKVSGQESWATAPFDLAGFREGRFTFIIESAWRCVDPYSYGSLHVETSDDQEHWEVFQNHGLTEGMCLIPQSDLRSGDLFQDEFYFTNPGRYARIVHDARSTIGEAYKGYLTIETSQR